MTAPGAARLCSWPFFAVPLEDLACVTLFAFFAMQGSIPGIAPSSALEMTGASPTGLTTVGGIVTQAVANALILVLVLRRPRLVLRHVAAIPWAGLLAILAVTSTAWSLDPLLTLRRSIPFALAAIFGLWFAVRFPAPRQMAILRLTVVVLAVATIAIVALAPSIGLDHTPGHAADWQGVFTQKNACGRMMVLASAVVLFGPRVTASRIASLFLFVFVLIMSGSRGAWMIEGAVFALWLAMLVARRSGTRLRLVFAVAAPIVAATLAAATAVLLPRILLFLGRDATLSGRTAIWTQVAHFIRQRPLFGHGYDAFWRGMTGPSFQIDAAVHFIVEHAHNGFLEIGLELGLVGLALFLISWLLAWSRLLPFWLDGDIAPIAFPLAMLVLIVLYDLDENTLLIYNGLFWPLYVATLASLEFAARDRRHQQRPARHGMLTAKPPADAALQKVP
jgi:exopolysaccharide production protein ExoQ